MSYSNITVVTAQGTFGYQPGTPFVPISYNTLDLIPEIPHNAQLEVERIFSIDRNGDTNVIPNFLNDTNVSVVDKQRVFIIPTDRITYNTTTKQITNVLLPSSGSDVYNYTFTYISGPNAGQTGTIAVPALTLGDNIAVRRKTVSNTPLVLWTAGSKLTTAQLNLNTTQLLYLIQELNNKITVTSISSEQILDNAITTAKILNGSVTSDKLFDLGGPKRLLGSGNVSANADGKYDVQELTLGDGFYWDANSTVLQVADITTGIKGDINVVSPRTDWRIVNDSVTYEKMQNVTPSRLLGRGAGSSGDPQELTIANNLSISGTELAVTTPLTDGSKGDITIASNGTVFTINPNSVTTADIINNAVSLDKLQTISTNTLLGRASTGTGNVETITLTAAGRALLDDVDAATQRTTLGLGSAATQDSTAFAAPTHTHSASDITTGTLAVSRGGTGVSATPTSGQLLIGNNTGFSLATITAGTNIAISNSPGGITISQVGEPVAPSAILADGTYGDITIAGNTWTVVNNAIGNAKIANDAVTFGKIQNINTNTVLGRATAGTGDVEEITVTAAGRALLDDADAAAQRTTLGLGTAATEASTAFAAAVHTHGTSGIDNAAITADKLASNAVTTTKITDLNVTTGKLANNAVTYTKMQTVATANRLLGSTTTNGAVSEVQVNTDMIADGAITAAKIAAGAVTFSASDLADGSITANKLGTDSVITAKIQDGAVTNAKISNRAGNSVMGRSANTAGVVADIVPTVSGQVLRYDGTNTGFGQVSENGILDGAITSAKIGDGQINNNKILNGTITVGKLNQSSLAFTTLPTSAVAPTNANDFTNKTYVDSLTRVGATHVLRKGGSNTTLTHETVAGHFTLVNTNLRCSQNQTWTFVATRLASGNVSLLSGTITNTTGITLDTADGYILTLVRTA